MMDKIKVNIWEYERGWGSKVEDVLEFDTLEEAQTFIKDYNSKNTLDVVPDWYMTARLAE